MRYSVYTADMKNSPVIMCVLAAALFSTCKHKDCRQTGTCPPEYYFKSIGGAKDYLWAKAGSYWIYKNTKTGDLDTVTCVIFHFDTITKKGTETYSQNVTIEFEYMFRGLYSTFSPYSYTETTTGYSANSIPVNNIRTILERDANSPGADIQCFFHPFELGVHAGTGAMYCSYLGMDSSCEMQGKTYYKVAKFDVDQDAISEPKYNCRGAHTIYHWAKDVGLIKKEVLTCNYNWELIEYNIIK